MTQAEYKAYYTKAIRQMSLRSTLLIILWNLFKVDKVRNSPTSMLVENLDLQEGKSWRALLFEATDADAGQFKYVQFSDTISLIKAEHFLSSLEAQARSSLKKWITG